jgi:hypothetical protein
MFGLVKWSQYSRAIDVIYERFENLDTILNEGGYFKRRNNGR